MIGTITHIQRLSIHDGPGIRSTIFLKGCNFRCAWCHNPEAFANNPELEWVSDKCINCHACVEFCEPKALSVKEGFLSFNKELCTNCFRCVDACFPEALKRIGRKITPEQLLKEIEIDFPFFEESKGGITLSGGEPLLQVEFSAEILKLFKGKGIHTAVETNLGLPWKSFEKLIPYLDYVMADIKLMENSIHKHWTKAGNILVIENIGKLDRTGIPFVLRTPVVPGVNDNEQSIGQILDFVGSLKNLIKHEFLPFHALAGSKYKNLGIKNPMEGIKGLSKGRIAQLKTVNK